MLKKTVYSFLEDLPPIETEQKWRVCLGYSVSCTKKVKGFTGDRLCTPCRKSGQSDGYQFSKRWEDKGVKKND